MTLTLTITYNEWDRDICGKRFARPIEREREAGTVKVRRTMVFGNL